MKYKVIVAGSRYLQNYEYVEEKLLNTFNLLKDEIIIICGMADGADMLGREFGLKHNLKVIEMPADWEGKGKYAGYMRNCDMAKEAKNDPNALPMLIAFWNGKSRGTKHMIDIASKEDIPTRIFYYEKED